MDTSEGAVLLHLNDETVRNGENGAPVDPNINMSCMIYLNT